MSESEVKCLNMTLDALRRTDDYTTQCVQRRTMFAAAVLFSYEDWEVCTEIG